MKFKSIILAALVLTNVIWFSCSNSTEIPAVDCSLSDLSVSVESQVRSDCSVPGSITVTATGGTGTYTYSADGVTFSASATLGGLFAGNYTITVRDSDGCTAETSTVLEAEPGAVSLTLDFTDSSCGVSTGTITASATGGVQPYTFSLNDGSMQSANLFNGVSNGSNTVTVRDSDGCEISGSVIVGSGVKLSTDIMPIISANCAVTGCHNGSRSPDLRTSSSIRANASRIKARTTAGTMPPADRADLAESDIEKIACWVDDGAPNN